MRAGRHHLDQVGAVGELAAGGAPHRVGAVGDLVHAGVVADRRGRDREQLAGEEHPRPGDLARPDRVAHGHLDVVPAADVAHGRDARPSPCGARRPPCTSATAASDRADGLRRVAGIGRLREVDVAVDQAGQQPRAVERRRTSSSSPRRARLPMRAMRSPSSPMSARRNVGVLDVVDLPTHQPAHGRHRRCERPFRT